MKWKSRDRLLTLLWLLAAGSGPQQSCQVPSSTLGFSRWPVFSLAVALQLKNITCMANSTLIFSFSLVRYCLSFIAVFALILCFSYHIVLQPGVHPPSYTASWAFSVSAFQICFHSFILSLGFYQETDPVVPVLI